MKQDEQSAKLLDCPFCGETPNVEQDGRHLLAIHANDWCILSNMSITAAAWNARAERAERPADVREAVDKVNEYLRNHPVMDTEGYQMEIEAAKLWVTGAFLDGLAAASAERPADDAAEKGQKVYCGICGDTFTIVSGKGTCQKCLDGFRDLHREIKHLHEAKTVPADDVREAIAGGKQLLDFLKSKRSPYVRNLATLIDQAERAERPADSQKEEIEMEVPLAFNPNFEEEIRSLTTSAELDDEFVVEKINPVVGWIFHTARQLGSDNAPVAMDMDYLRQGTAKVKELVDEAVKVWQERERKLAEAEAEVERLRKAWSESWDCSADPGHSIMESAFGPKRECDHEWNPIGDYCIKCGVTRDALADTKGENKR